MLFRNRAVEYLIHKHKLSNPACPREANLCNIAPHLISFDFNDGDELMFKDEGDNAVIHIDSITYDCSGNVLYPRGPVLNVSWHST